MTLWQNSTTGPGQQFWKDAIAAFEEENPNVTIKMQSIQNEDMDGKLQTSLNAGDPPDIFLQRGGGKMAAMVQAGQLMDLTGKITGEAKDNISEGSFKAETYQDKVWAMPLSVLPGRHLLQPGPLRRRGDHRDPDDDRRAVAANEKLKATGVAPLALGAKAAWPAAHWFYWFAIRECAPATMEETGDSKDFSDPCWLKAAEDLDDFAKTNPFNEGFLTTSPQEGAGSSAGLVANHQAGGELMGAWDPGVIASLTPDEKPLPDLAWYPFPEVSGGKGEPGSMMGGVDGYSCSAQAPKECADFLSFIGSDDQQTAYYKAYNSPPVNTVAQEACHRTVPAADPRGLQPGSVRLAVARHGARPERRQRAQRGRRRHARRFQLAPGHDRRRQPGRREGLGTLLMTTSETPKTDDRPETDLAQRAGGGGVTPPPSAPPRSRRKGIGRAGRWEIALLAGPAVIFFVGFVIFPVIVAAYYGFFNWHGYGPATDFIGLKNYVTILTDPAFQEALGHNGFILVMSLVIQGPVALLLALLLNRKMRGQSLIRVLIFVPYVIAEVVVGTGFSLMLATNGALNGLLENLGL